ncbi:dynamin family protein [Flavonifractor sp. AGMB03687]|uniref:dynamin family protein n=1 Tax=Clostridia TaxID=186801 RepID=UPI001ADF2FE0|nr:dynamin family protein [Flavonifractor sp. AGMB03687]
MAQVYVKYNPYRLETTVKVNGRDVSTDSILYKVTKGKRLQEWIGKFPKMLREELNTLDFSLEYCGMALDWDDFEDAFEQAQKEGIIKVSNMKYIAGKSDEDINEKIVKVFQDLQEGPLDDFRDAKLTKAFENTNNAIFPVNVIATMSSGKSTLINALLGKKLMPSKNEACTATITEILDADDPTFAAVVYDEDDVVLQEVPHLTYEIMNELNDNPNVHRISTEGDIPFLDSKSTALMLVDTPGPNNSQNQAHKNTTYRAINNDSNNLILYVLNGTQLSTNDDAALLHYVADQIKKGGKQVRDRFLFVINKMDQFNPQEESIEKAILSAKRYLASYGIDDPQLFPCSAFTALNIKTDLAGIDIDNLTRAQERQLPISARDTLLMIDKFLEFESMHLEKYSTLSPSAQQELNFRLSRAIESGDTKEQALIHSGIYSIEAAITAYVKKYAKTKKIKDLVESFQEVLESSEVLVKAKTRVATDEKAAKACAERAAAVRQKIADGEEAEVFKQKIADLDPMPIITEKAEQLKQNATTKSNKIFRPYGETLTSRDEAKRLVNQFSTFSSDAMAELTSELESVINREIVSTGERLLMEYQEKVSKFDESSNDEQLDFQTLDLIKGALNTMRETAESWTTDDFASETVEDIGETTYEERTYYEKVGQEEEEIVVGSHEEKVGTRKVKVGSHREKVGTRRVKKSGFFAKIARIFGGGYEEEDVYETVDDYKDEDVYKTVLEYKTIMRDVFEEKTEHIEKFSVSTALIQQALIAKMRRNLDEGTESALGFAEEQVEAMKAQFSRIFTELDEIIASKYAELEKCATDESEKRETLQKNKDILEWIETNMNEINSILDM